MALYINGLSCISPQRTFDNSEFLPEVKEYTVNRMACVDADYSKLFDAGSLRRMGRLMKYGTAAGLLALKDAGINIPGAISTGTALGLPEVSQKFLRSLIEVDETIVSPTTFIQSTHNTVSSNIALLCGCHAHNNTFSHKGFSFESALTDAQVLSKENVDNILVGAYDEVSDYKYAAMKKTNELREEPCSNLDFRDSGIVAGEGAAFFVLGKEKTNNTYGIFVSNKTFYKPQSAAEVKENINQFLEANELSIKQVDIVICGISGDKQNDFFFIDNQGMFNSGQTIVAYKHLCGEYMTSSAFAFWLASKIMKTQTVPESVVISKGNRSPKNILLYNSHKHNHSLMLFRAC